MTLYETIFVRRSVRKFLAEPLPNETLASIKSHLENLKQLDGQNAKFEVVTGQSIGNSKAPYFILAFSEKTAAAYANVGYCLQEMDLYIQSKNLGSLWLGTASLKEKSEKNDFCIMLAFGKTDVPERSSLNEFKRLPIDKVSNVDNKIVRAAILAPSAVNSQPWKLTWTENHKAVIEYFGRGILKSILKNKFAKIDMGIFLKCLVLALENNAKKVVSITPKTQSGKFLICVTFEDI